MVKQAPVGLTRRLVTAILIWILAIGNLKIQCQLA
jgi:hypothetical protein